MNRYRKFVRRYFRARAMGIPFRGTSYTRLPSRFRFGGRVREIRVPDQALMIADFINVVLDDDYGLRGLAPAPRVIVDVGANVGHFCNLARDCFPEAIIHGYEPEPGNAALARSNTDHPLTTIFEEGVAAQEGRADIVDLGTSNIMQTQVSAQGAIPLVSFATVLKRAGGNIDLLKVDCEGAEWDFMTDRELFAQVERIRMEYHLVGGRTIEDVHGLARAIGHQIELLEENNGFGLAWMKRA